jgi:uncharacterized RDD family membrane protein YckC
MDSSTNSRPIAVPAALGWRLLALVYDLLPTIPMVLVISTVILALHGGRPIEHSPAWAAVQWVLIWLLVGQYFVVSWRRGGQTMGMRPWRLQVLAADGKPASWRASWLRYLVASLTPGLCLLWTLVDDERRGLHDLAAGTLLVRREPAVRQA